MAENREELIKKYKERIKNEFKKSFQDIIYFARNYFYISHPTRGRLLFDLFDFQERTLKEILENNDNIILKSRQMGISTLMAMYSLYLMIFYSDTQVVVVAINQDVAKNVVSKVRYAYGFLPKFFKKYIGELVADNRMSLSFKNNSSIKAVTSTENAGRSESATVLIVDETAFIENIDSIWTAIQQTAGTGGRKILLSCVTGDTFIYTNIGIRQVKDFVPNEEFGDYEIDDYQIRGNGKLRKGNLFHNNGKVKTKKIVTKYNEVEGSFNHKLWACKNGNYDWYRLDELDVGDWVNIQYGMNEWGNNDFIEGFSNKSYRKSSKQKSVYNFNKITSDLAYFLGLYLAEGSVYLSKNKKGDVVGSSITIVCGDDISSILNKLGFTYSCHDGLHYTISSKYLYELMEYLGLDVSLKAHEKEISKKLMSMSKKNVASMLSGIFDGDGFSDSIRGRVGINLSSEKLIKQIRILLLNFGIRSTYSVISKEKMNSYNYFEYGFNFDNHRLEIGSDTNIFYNEIGFKFHRKNKNKLIKRGRSDVGSYHSKDVIPNSLNLMKEMFEYYDGGVNVLRYKENLNITSILSKKTQYKTINVSKKNVMALYDLVKNKLPQDRLNYINKILIPNSSWVSIKEIQESENYTYDFSLPNDDSDFWGHSILYNGILGHQTPNGMGGFFHQKWVSAMNGENTFNPIRLPWHLHPERGEEWRKKQTVDLGPKLAAQECDCDFIASGETFIENEIIKYFEDSFIQEPVEKRGEGGNYWIWKYPDYSKTYIVSCDVSRGDGTDFQTIEVFEIEELEQVAEYKGQTDIKTFGNFAVNVATEYNDAILVIENTGIGWSAIQPAIDRDYDNLFYTHKNDKNIVSVKHALRNGIDTYNEHDMIPGFNTHEKNRINILSKLKQHFLDRSIIIRSIRLINELYVFTWINNKPQASKGYNDDLVMALSILLWVRDISLKLRQNNKELTKKAIEQIGTYRNIRSSKNLDKSKNPHKINLGGVEEDVSWLLDK